MSPPFLAGLESRSTDFSICDSNWQSRNGIITLECTNDNFGDVTANYIILKTGMQYQGSINFQISSQVNANDHIIKFQKQLSTVFNELKLVIIKIPESIVSKRWDIIGDLG